MAVATTFPLKEHTFYFTAMPYLISSLRLISPIATLAPNASAVKQGALRRNILISLGSAGPKWLDKRQQFALPRAIEKDL